MHLIKEPFTRAKKIFENTHSKKNKDVETKPFLKKTEITEMPDANEMPETTDNNAVPLPGQVWRCEFTSQQKTWCTVFTMAVTGRANISAD